MTDGGLFESMYARADRNAGSIPWASLAPSPILDQWLANTPADPAKAVVVACGLGDDAEALAAGGWNVTAFDISPTAIAWARERFPGSTVDYEVADLFSLPTGWAQSFSLVVEALTIQSISPAVREQACRAVADLVAPGGTLLVAAIGHDGPRVETGPPWPLMRDDLDTFPAAGLEQMTLTVRPSAWEGFEHFEIEYSRPGPAGSEPG